MSDQMEAQKNPENEPGIRDIVRQAIEEFVKAEQRKAEPAYQTQLQDERKRRESLEGRLNQLVEENRKARAAAEESERSAQILSDRQRLVVAKVDIASQAVKHDIVREDNGQLQAKGTDAKWMDEYLA